MRAAPTRPSAVLLVREPGEIIFANPLALEQVVWLTGAPPGEGWTLADLVALLFPYGGQPQRARRVLARALAVARRRGSLQCRLSVPRPELGPTTWEVHISHLPGHAETTYEVGFRRTQEEPRRGAPHPSPAGHLLHTALQQTVRILDRATSTEDPAPPEVIPAVLELLDQARALLVRLEGEPTDPVPLEPRLRGEG